MSFPNLPGLQINTVDGGLIARTAPTSKSTLVLGTSDSGPTDPYFVQDRAAAAQAFGFNGNLVRAMEEVGAYSDNTILYRLGTSPASLSGIGYQLAVATNVTTTARTAGIATYTSASHGIVAGQSFVAAGFSDSTFNGTFVATSVGGSTVNCAQTGSDVVSGSMAGTLKGITSAGFAVSFSGSVSPTSSTDYKIWYKNGVLAVYLSGNIVYSNQGGASLDIGNVVLSNYVIGNMTGLQFGSGSVPSLSNAITLTAAAALSGSVTTPSPVLTAAVTGTGLTGRQLYIALAKALDLLQIFPVDQVYCPAAIVNQPNVAYFVAADASTVVNNPVSNVDALDWLKTTTASDGSKTYQWANDSTDSNGATVSPMSGVSTAAQRITAGFYEANFAYLLANFCEVQQELSTGCIGFVPTLGPVSFRLGDTRSWIGYLPTYDPVTSVPTAPGSGLLGIPVLAGTTAAKLNPLAVDFATGYRKPGLFKTNEGVYDGSLVTDLNANPVDIGAYLHVFADHGIMSNGFLANYEGNLAGLVAGFCSKLDPKSGLTNKPLNVLQLWKQAFNQMDQLTQANINVLRFKGLNVSPVILHDKTAANPNSDYINLVRVRIKFLVVSELADEADNFIGSSSIDGLQLSALRTALEARMVKLQKRSYVSFADFQIGATSAEQRVGHARIDVQFMPANELVQLSAFVGIRRPTA